jgi:DNA-binding CsgD family transcriptional regulator
MKSIVSQLDEISRLYHEEGLSVPQIAARLGATPQSISYHVRRGNLVLKKRTLDRDELTRLRVEEGLSLAAIANRLNTHKHRVSRELKSYGIDGPRAVRPPDPLDHAELRRLYVDERLPVEKVAARMGVGVRKIRTDLDRAGIEVRRYTSQFETRQPSQGREPVIRLGKKVQVSGLPESAEKYRIQVDSRTVNGVSYLVIGMAEISRLYNEEGLTTRQIGGLLGFASSALYWHKRRGNVVLDYRGVRENRRKKTFDENLLRDLYVEQQLTTTEIARRLATTRAVVVRELDRYGMRRPGQRNGRILCGSRRVLINDEELRRLYVHDGLSLNRIAEMLGTTAQTVRNAMIRFGIGRRGDGGERKYQWMPGMKVGDEITIQVEAWRERPPSGLRKAAGRNGIKVKAKRIGEGQFLVRRIK